MEDRFVDQRQADRGYTTTTAAKEADPHGHIPPNVMARRQVLRLFEELSAGEREALIRTLLEVDGRLPGPYCADGGRLRPPTSTAPIERTTVLTALDQQQNNIGDLHNQLQELEARLHTMLQHPPVDSCGQAAMPAPVQVVDRVIMHNQGIRSACDIVRQLLARVDL